MSFLPVVKRSSIFVIMSLPFIINLYFSFSAMKEPEFVFCLLGFDFDLSI